jgi:Tol biopolymer transport system component
LYEKQRPDDQRFEIWRASVNRTGAEQRVYGTTDNLIPLDWSIDGYLLYRRSDADYLSSDLLALPLSSDDPIPIVVADSTFEERMGAFSPDGRWVVYDTARSGRFEIVVQSFPERGEEFRVSIDGGLAPLWSADGTEIYFVARDGTMMAARVTTSGSGSGFAAEQPKALFPTQLRDQPYNQQYAVTSDRRFLVSSLTVEEFPAPISVILNWRP